MTTRVVTPIASVEAEHVDKWVEQPLIGTARRIEVCWDHYPPAERWLVERGKAR